jgi:predicted DNA-binding protein (UPF0251 family)
LDELAEETLSLEELEAIRLSDLERCDQATAALEMRVSQSTFNRVLVSARRKLARGIIEGKAITIKGGHFELSSDRWRCMSCGKEWRNAARQQPVPADVICPSCGKACAAIVVSSNARGSRREPVP